MYIMAYQPSVTILEIFAQTISRPTGLFISAYTLKIWDYVLIEVFPLVVFLVFDQSK